MILTFDLDHMKEQKIENKAVLLKSIFPYSSIRYRISSSGKGGHILAYIDEELPENEQYNIRYLLGDHPRRICIDASRGKNGKPNFPQQVLFDIKIKKGKILKAGEWKYV